jgi:hypothetical protein
MDRNPVEGSRYPLDLAFRGDRDYLQGGDIFTALIELTGWRGAVSLHFHRLMRSGVDAMEIPDGRPGADFDAVFWYGPTEKQRCLGLRADPSRTVLARIPYDEESVVADAVIVPPRIESPGPGRASFIERVLALDKLLLKHQFAPEKGRIRLARLDLDYVPASPREIVLIHQASLGPRLMRCRIMADGHMAGSIFASFPIALE